MHSDRRSRPPGAEPRPFGPTRPRRTGPCRFAGGLRHCRALGAALVLSLALAGCASSLDDSVAGNQLRVSVSSPKPGAATIVLLRFYLKPGAVPHLRITNAYRQAPTAAFVGGIARVGKENNRFVGLAAIVNFAGDNPTAAADQPRARAAIEGSQPFYVDYVGDLQAIGSQVSNVQALVQGISGPEAWTVDWFNQPDVVSDAGRPFVQNGTSLLDATFRRLAGRPSPGYVQAITGLPKGRQPTLAAGGTSRTTGPGSPPQSGPRGGAAPGARSAGPSGPGSPGTNAPSQGPAQPATPAQPTTPAGGSGPATPPAGTPGGGGRTNVVAASTTPGPKDPGRQVTATAVCPAGTQLTGGGFHLHTTSGAIPNNSLRGMGTFASATDGSPVGSGVSRSWATLGGAGGVPMDDALTTSVAVCSSTGPSNLAVVVESTFGPQGAATSTSVTATCPAGSALYGGGASTLVPPDPIQPSLHLIASYPSDPSGKPAASGSTTSSWTAIGAAGGAQINNGKTTAFAVCGTGAGAKVVSASQLGPETASTETTATAVCPAGTLLMGGGVKTDLNGGTPQQGVHLTGSYPATSGGAPVAAGKPANAWAVIVHAGGQPTPGTMSHSFAMCAP